MIDLSKIEQVYLYPGKDGYETWVMYNMGKMNTEDLLPWSEKVPDEIYVHRNDLEKRVD